MQDKTYLFILGRYPDLSKLEIFAVLRQKAIKSDLVFESDTVLILKSKEEIMIDELNRSLGGTVKIGVALTVFPQSSSHEKLEDYFTSSVLFSDIFINPSPKINFGVSFYPYARHFDRTNLIGRFQRQLIPLLKSHLEAQGFSARYPHLEGTYLSSASVEKNKLLTTGAEILLIETPTELYIGKTVAVQEFESFSQRDYGRPKRDMESGIMPPKIARMMINLAEVEHTDHILDPFCGSGTLLQEALLLGYTQLIGTDLSQKAISDSKQNLAWLQKNAEITSTPHLFQYDVTKLAEKIPPASIRAIITEPYMGPNFQQKPHLKDVQKNKAELEDLYLSAFKAYAKILKQGGSVVMILPIFHVNTHYLTMDILDKIQLLGFSQVVLSKGKRNSIIIGNNKDYVLREIIKWKKEEI